MNPFRKIAFGYSTRCNIKCEHCVASDDRFPKHKMDLSRATAIIEEMADNQVRGISFTAGEPLIFLDDIYSLIQVCKINGIYSRVVTNGFWAKTPEQSDRIVSELIQKGLSQLRISYSRWHQKFVNQENIVNAASSCKKLGLEYFISFITDFSAQDDSYEAFLRDHKVKFFPEPIIYFGRAGRLNHSRIHTDYQANQCAMNPYLSPELDMYACCDAGNQFTNTDFFLLGNLENDTIDRLFQMNEENILFNLIRNMGLTDIASYLGYSSREIITYRKCELCEKLFNSKENLACLEEAVNADLLTWKR